VLCNVTLRGQHTLTNDRIGEAIQDISATKCWVSLGCVRVLQLIPRNRPLWRVIMVSAFGQKPPIAL
jgi:hypothetical protein